MTPLRIVLGVLALVIIVAVTFILTRTACGC